MTAISINRADVMAKAWAAIKTYSPAPNVTEFRRRLSRELRQAWFSVKRAAQVAAQSEAEKAREAASLIENKATLTDADYAEIAARKATAAALDQAEKRDLILAAGGRFVSVTFTKKDGTERTMKVQPAAIKSRIKGEAASPAAQRAVATRAARHPHLMNVWDVEAGAPRSINLATVSCIVSDGMAYAYQ